MIRTELAALAVLLVLCGGAAAAPAAPTAAAQHPLLDMHSIHRGIKAARMEVQVALADPARAFEAYLARFAAVSAPHGHPLPGGPSDSKSRADRLQVFTQNLQKAAARNAAAGGALLAYGITPFMHLTQEEYQSMYLGTADASTAAEVVTWTADEAAASRKLLGYAQASEGSSALAAAAQADVAGPARHSDSVSPPGSGSSSSKDGAIELLLPPAPGLGSAAAPTPPAQQLPARRGREGGPRPPAGMMPTLPYNPEPGAAGCSAQRSYPYTDVVPPADGVNWVLAGGTTPVKDQGLCGSCVAFATTALAEFMHMRKFGTTNTTTDLSEQDLLDCTNGDGCQGQYQTAYVNLIGCSGIALEADGPYRAADGGRDLCRPARRYSGMAHGEGGGWASVVNSPDNLAQAVSQAPVMLTLDASDWALYAGGILDCDAPGKAFNHAVTVVGYINLISQPNGEHWDVFLVRNSFGAWWGGGNGPYAGHILIRKCPLTVPVMGPSAMHALEAVVPLYG